MMIFLTLFVLFSVSLGIDLRMEQRQLYKLQKIEVKEKQKVFYEIKKLDLKSIFLLASDYSYWDELVNAIRNLDHEWFKINIDSGLKTYDADGVWIYNMDFKEVYAVSRFEGQDSDPLALDKAHTEEIFKDKAIIQFRMQTPSGYWEVQGATVHPSNDSERKTPSRGYIFVGKLLNQEYLTRLSGLTNVRISVKPAMDSVVLNPGPGVFVSIFNDWKNEPLFAYVGTVNDEGPGRFRKISLIFVTMFVIYTVVQAACLLYFLMRFFKEIKTKSR